MTKTYNLEEMVNDFAHNLVRPGFWQSLLSAEIGQAISEIFTCNRDGVCTATTAEKLSACTRYLDRVNSKTRKMLNGCIKAEIELEDLDEEEPQPEVIRRIIKSVQMIPQADGTIIR